jgi:hypothetical protein
MTLPPQPGPDQHPTPYSPGGPAYPPPPGQTIAAAPGKKRNPLWWILAGVAALAVVIGGTVAFTLAASSNIEPARGLTAWEQEQQQAANEPSVTDEALPDPTTPAPSYTPTPSDIKLKPKVIDKECFGSAGCNVVFKVDLTYGGSALDEATTWLVTYEVTGVQDGPMIGSLELTGETFTASEEITQTKSSKSKITIKVTDVDKVGI